MSQKNRTIMPASAPLMILTLALSATVMAQTTKVRKTKLEARSDQAFLRTQNPDFSFSPYFIKTKSRTTKFKFPHSVTASGNGNFFAIYPADLGGQEPIAASDWDYEYFHGLVDRAGNVLWQNPNLEKADHVSNSGDAVFNVVPNPTSSPWAYLSIYHATHTVKLVPISKGIDDTNADFSSDGSRVVFSVKELDGARVFVYDKHGTKHLDQKVLGSSIRPEVAISPSGEEVMILNLLKDHQEISAYESAGRRKWVQRIDRRERKNKARFLSGDRVALIGKDGVSCLDSNSGKMTWHYKAPHADILEIADLKDGDRFVMIARETPVPPKKFNDRKVILIDNMGNLLWQEKFSKSSSNSISMRAAPGSNKFILERSDGVYAYEID